MGLQQRWERDGKMKDRVISVRCFNKIKADGSWKIQLELNGSGGVNAMKAMNDWLYDLIVQNQAEGIIVHKEAEPQKH
jgi:hypothetical protein